MDTSSIIHFNRFELAGKKIIKYLEYCFGLENIIVLTKEIDLKRQLKNIKDEEEKTNLEQEIKQFLQKIEIKVEDFDCKNCEHAIERFYNKKDTQDYYEINQEDYRKIDEGEKECLKVALFISRQYKHFVIFITDDFDAINYGIKDFIEFQKIGHLITFYDFVIFLYSRLREINKNDALKAIGDFFDSDEEPVKKPEKIEEKEIAKKMIIDSCLKECDQQCRS